MNKLLAALLISLITISSVFAQHGWERINYPSSTVFTGVVTVDNEPIAAGDGVVGVFVGDECRMIAEVRVLDDVSYVSAVVHCSDSITAPEAATIKFWEKATDTIYVLEDTIEITVNGDIRLYPINIEKSIEEPSSNVEIELSDEFVSAFPVPFESELTLSSEKEIESVSLIDDSGKLILKEDDVKANEVVLQTNTLIEGVYFAKIQFVDGSVTSKSVVKD